MSDVQNERMFPYCVGQWLSSDQKILDSWLSDFIDATDYEYKEKEKILMKLHPINKDDEELSPEKPPRVEDLQFHPPVQALMNTILSDPVIHMHFHQMYWQQFLNPNAKGIKIPNWQMAILLINKIMRTAPLFNKHGLVGCPINAILNWPMATSSGHLTFLNEKINAHFKEILNYWAKFLESEDSRYVLNNDPKNGWFGEDAMAAMPNFVDDFICDPNMPYYGYKSWDDFFTRRLRPGTRPIEYENDDSVVANSCESSPFKISTNVKDRDYFWIKSQKYSMRFILNHHKFFNKFVGGTIYQGFLSALSYHRWHSPVNGFIVDIELIDGTYYSQCPHIQNDENSPNLSQPYLAQVAARGVVYIQADNPDIGLMAFVSIGMAEVSTSEITVKKGDRVKKGDELGAFHYGGSTYLLIFRPGVNVQFDLHGEKPGIEASNIKVNQRIATVLPSRS